MKILHVIDSGGLYGAEIMLLSLMDEQKKHGHHPVLCSIGTDINVEKPIEKQAKEMDLNLMRFTMRPGLNLLGAHKIVRYGILSNADIFHSHGYKPNILLSFYPRAFFKIPVVTTTHGWTNAGKISRLAAYEWFDVQDRKSVV